MRRIDGYRNSLIYVAFSLMILLVDPLALPAQVFAVKVEQKIVQKNECDNKESCKSVAISSVSVNGSEVTICSATGSNSDELKVQCPPEPTKFSSSTSLGDMMEDAGATLVSKTKSYKVPPSSFIEPQGTASESSSCKLISRYLYPHSIIDKTLLEVMGIIDDKAFECRNDSGSCAEFYYADICWWIY
ncbi:MAG: hypothetical protein QXU32_10765 [Nitrososphaerales archaeon]